MATYSTGHHHAGEGGDCCEPTSPSANVNWRYVGAGGSFNDATQYVPSTGGKYIRQDVVAHHGCRPRPICWYILGTLCCVPLILVGLWFLLALMPQPKVLTEVDPRPHVRVILITPPPTVAPQQDLVVPVSTTLPPTTTGPPLPSCALSELALYPEALQHWCCTYRKRCWIRATSTLPPIVIQQRVVQRFTVADCNDDYVENPYKLLLRWSQPKRKFCCKYSQRGCPGATTPAVSFDCNAGALTWQRGWSDTKKKWCCDHRMPLKDGRPLSC